MKDVCGFNLLGFSHCQLLLLTNAILVQIEFLSCLAPSLSPPSSSSSVSVKVQVVVVVVVVVSVVVVVIVVVIHSLNVRNIKNQSFKNAIIIIGILENSVRIRWDLKFQIAELIQIEIHVRRRMLKKNGIKSSSPYKVGCQGVDS